MNDTCENKTFLENSSNWELNRKCKAVGTSVVDDKKFTIVYSMLVLLGIAIVVANAFVVYLFTRNAVLRRRQNYFLISLAMSDWLAGAVIVPLLILCAEGTEILLCVAMDTCTRFLAVSTVLHLLAATSERYVKIAKPFLYNVVVTEERSTILLAAIWVISLTTSSIQLTWIDIGASEERQEQIRRLELIYSSICLAVFVFFPFIGIVIFHVLLINIIVRKKKTQKFLSIQITRSRKRKRRKAMEKKAALILMAMTLNFVVGWFPYFTMSVFSDITSNVLHLPFWLDVTLLFIKLNTALVNPVLYTYFKADFHSAFKSLFVKTSKQRLRSASQIRALSSDSNKRKGKPSQVTEIRISVSSSV